MISTVIRRGSILGGTAAIAAATAALSSPVSSTAEISSGTSTSEHLTASEWRSLKLIHKEYLTKGERPTMLFRFALPEGQPSFPVTNCLLARLPVGKPKEDGSRGFVMRPYTPVSAPDAQYLELAIKIYGDGKLTPHLSDIKVNDVVDFKGPLPKLDITEATKKSSIGMVAGGTGITPMLQLATELLRQGYTRPISLIYANVSSKDIMLKDHVEKLVAEHSNFKVYYVVDKADKSWKGGVGYVTKDMIEDNMPRPGGNALVAVCGPPGMMRVVSGEKVSPKEQGPVEGILKRLGYVENEVYKF